MQITTDRLSSGLWTSYYSCLVLCSLLVCRRIPHGYDPGTVSPKAPADVAEEQLDERRQKRLFNPGVSGTATAAAVGRPRRSSETTRILTKAQQEKRAARAKKKADTGTRVESVMLDSVVN